ncbi:MAG: DUF3108 domain-containing protein [Bacteroidales bacterium]|nr:DUF3108 domain-containing protein [Bacteroidales bacterium]
MRLILIVFIVFVSTLNSSAQCFRENTAFTIGEQLDYEVYYNLGSLWLNAGYVEFDVKPRVYRGKEVYHLDGTGGTYKSYDWIFTVRDHYQSYLDKDKLVPVWFRRQNDEGGFKVDYEYEFDSERKKIYSKTWNSERPYREDTLDLLPCTFDVMSLVYYARNLDFSGMNPGDSIPTGTFIDNERYDLYIRYLGKETIETREGTAYRCIKFSALLVEGTIFKGGEDLQVWVTDDSNRVPVIVEAKILVGSIKTYLKSAQGLRNPPEARISP